MLSRVLLSTGAAGNFLAPISKLSENGFRTVIEIDTVRPRLRVADGRTGRLTLDV